MSYINISFILLNVAIGYRSHSNGIFILSIIHNTIIDKNKTEKKYL